MSAPTPTHDVAMDAGPEMDALVAERVMGWTLEAYEEGRASTFEAFRESGFSDGWTWVGGDDSEEAHRWRPSKSIAKAFEVIEHLGAKFHAVIRTPFEPGLPYHAGFTPHSTTGWNGRSDFCAEAPTAALAICRAALLAVRS